MSDLSSLWLRKQGQSKAVQVYIHVVQCQHCGVFNLFSYMFTLQINRLIPQGYLFEPFIDKGEKEDIGEKIFKFAIWGKVSNKIITWQSVFCTLACEFKIATAKIIMQLSGFIWLFTVNDNGSWWAIQIYICILLQSCVIHRRWRAWFCFSFSAAAFGMCLSVCHLLT